MSSPLEQSQSGAAPTDASAAPTTHGKIKRVIVTSTNRDELIRNLTNFVQRFFDAHAESTQEKIVIGLSGGSLPTLMSDVFAKIERAPWKKLVFIFCDERRVTFGSPDSIYGAYLRDVIGRTERLNESTWINIEPFLSVGDCAKDYEAKVRSHFPEDAKLPAIDLLLLGMGPDGHTASLFPGHYLLEQTATNTWVAAVSNSPKPPPERVTLTLPVINAAKRIAFVATGAEKADVVQKILEGGDRTLPAGRVSPHGLQQSTGGGGSSGGEGCVGELFWFLDSLSASKLAHRGSEKLE